MLNVAILGAGAISESHLQAYQKCAHRARVVALVDRFPEKAAEETARHGLQAKVFKDFDELLKGCDFEVASIYLPPFEHAPAAVATCPSCFVSRGHDSTEANESASPVATSTAFGS